LPDGLPYGLPIMNGIHSGMRAHEIKAKKNRHIRRLFSFGGGLNGRDCDTEDDCDDDTGCDNRGDHGPIIITFNTEGLPIFILSHGVRPPLVPSEWQRTIGAP